MKKICSSCGKDLGLVPGAEDADGVSHGLCRPCSVHFLADVGMPLEEFIEGLGVPVITIANDTRVAGANKDAKEMLGNQVPEVSGLLSGDVFECEHALLPEGCGKTVHCSGCAIRLAVTDTIETGHPHRNVPAFLSHHTPEGSRKTDMLISTEKRGGVVLLSIIRRDEGL